MWPAILAGLRFVGTAATGYWINDVATWINTTFGLGRSTVNSKGNGFAWWYIAIIFIVMAAVVGAIIYFVASFFYPAANRRSTKRRR